MENKNKIIVTVIYLVAIILIIGGFAYFNKGEAPVVNNDTSTSTVSVATTSPIVATSTVETPLDTFAKCVAGNGLAMYGAAWCSHCAAEKKAFGESFRYIKYVECPDNVKLCTDLGINGYPTWIDSLGKKYEGEQGLSGLAKITGCRLP